MRENRSPWLYQLKGDRPHKILERDAETDVAIVGAGIAGVSTAFFILKHTDKKVLLLERFKLAHGATGHNAGQIASYFERGFSSIVEEFGLKLAAEGQKAVEDSWELLDEMYTDANLTIEISRFLGHAGLSSFEQVLLHLKNNYCRKKGGLNTERILIADDANFLKDIPEEYAGLFSIVPREEIRSTLETGSGDFSAVVSYQKGCTNSALLCEGIILYLLEKFPERFAFYEHTAANKIVLRHECALLDTGAHTVEASRVVLCTNGFEGITILNESGLDINTKFHHLLHGTVGYMSGYFEKMNKPPVAISYFTEPEPGIDNPYFYLTRRTYDHEKYKDHNLISIGGPETSLEDSTLYSRDAGYPDEMCEKIDAFVKKTYSADPNGKIDYIFTWHGLMGYTKNGVRLIGPEPKNPALLYNLGCNGVGILPSLYGGRQIARSLSGERLGKSIFDVPL